MNSPQVAEIADFFRLFVAGHGLLAELAATSAQGDDVLKLKLISAQVSALTSLQDDVAARGSAAARAACQYHIAAAESRIFSRHPKD